MTIVVAEDDNAVRKTLTKIIKHKIDSNIDIFEAEDGEIAYKIIQEQQVDILLTDMMMPNMDGFELTKKLRKDVNKKNIFIAAITGLSGDELIGKIYESGIDFYISKPFSTVDIVARLSLIIRLVNSDMIKTPIIKRDTLNPYNDDKIKNFYVIFTIYQEEDLYTLGEYITNKKKFINGVNILAKEVIINLIKTYQSIKDKTEAFEIMLEESESAIYISIMNDIFVQSSKHFFSNVNNSMELRWKKNGLTIRIPYEL
ncbi:response regulator [Hydrogenimonas thermophila]|uniref:Response regulator receiver domain-containing protein n=1 Tax=Hydrogenimonas thermophila TaxID=223786 RepID=A0A1I5PFY8_9BACT|nr:response regulator [Hydrogenimonas thermophila]WOE70741.1 response regulator [Hydrogenimonas thermophila]WOE73258.1 response regulator [Hydrogenimonas thermophila]SFP32945.1 Response regulator receiver domain-containing protein [Hydrogenimonas thermophila]